VAVLQHLLPRLEGPSSERRRTGEVWRRQSVHLAPGRAQKPDG